MANRIFEQIFTQGTHEVGVLNSSFSKHIVNGAKLTVADSDNYLLVEDAGFDSEGVRLVKPLTDTTKKGLLLTTVEEEVLFGDAELQGNYTDFYNAVDEMVRPTIQEEYLHFETSAYSLNTGVTVPAYGLVAHYDVATKKYILSDAGSAHLDYATAGNKYLVVGVATDFGANVGKATIRLEFVA